MQCERQDGTKDSQGGKRDENARQSEVTYTG